MEEPVQYLDENILNDLRDLMGNGFEPLIHTFIRDSDVRLEKLKKLLQLKEVEKLRQLAHAFKCSCLNVGAKTLVKICKEIEDLARENNVKAASDAVNQLDRHLNSSNQALLNYLSHMD